MLEHVLRVGEPLLSVQKRDQALLWPLSEVAMVREEWPGRLEVTSRTGDVAHRDGPVDPWRRAPLHEVRPGVLVHPGYAERREGMLHLPGGWRIPDGNLPGYEVPGPEDSTVPLGLRPQGEGYVWLTATGERPGPSSLPKARKVHPDLFRFGRHYVRPGGIRELRRVGTQVQLTLAGGRVLLAGWGDNLKDLVGALELAWPDLVPERHRVLYARELRDWPTTLLELETEELRRRYGQDPTLLVDHVIWEALRRPHPERAINPRGLFYRPLKVLAVRAGLLSPAAAAPVPGGAWASSLQGSWDSDWLWKELQDRLELFVAAWRLCTFQQLGFLDRGQPNRLMGTARPEVVLLVEKSSLEVDAAVVAREFGVSMLVLGGTPSWIATEFFATELRSRIRGPIRIVSLCDFDPYGWDFPRIFASQMERYGIETEGVVRLVRPERFTPEELELLALPIPTNAVNRELIRRWVEESGGVGGRALGLYADYLRPVQRLRAAFREDTGLVPLG